MYIYLVAQLFSDQPGGRRPGTQNIRTTKNKIGAEVQHENFRFTAVGIICYSKRLRTAVIPRAAGC